MFGSFVGNIATKDPKFLCNFTTSTGTDLSIPGPCHVASNSKWRIILSGQIRTCRTHLEAKVKRMSFSMARIVLDFRKFNLIQALFSKCHFSLSRPFYCYRHKSFLIMSNMQGKGQLESRGLTNQRNYTDKILEASPRIHKIQNSICLKCHQFIISIV